MIKKIAVPGLISFWCILIFASFTYPIQKNAQQPGPKPVLKRIVIDPGHGGSDFGASGKYSHEKDIALAVALKLEKEIHQQMPDVDVYMTRTTDVYDNVKVKAIKANQAKGDLFISIHCNYGDPIRHSEFIGYKTETYHRKGKKYTRKVKAYKTYTTPNPAKGTETYIWGVDKNDDKEKALRENESLYMDNTLANEMKDFDPNDPAKIVLYSLKTQQYAERSQSLALTVEDEFTKMGRVSREAKQRGKGIWVLQAVAMPAILVETGFLSNPEEEDYLNSQTGQQEIAEAIARAVKRYKFSLENKMQVNGTAQNPK
ncbi:MAG: N-acetylmuramoyl-L-alanine amidase [Sphingobacteriales bacterium]|uniref:N-acetylmuramoyl-L-alanine amidase family protein n=1 Tax=Hydrotalea flava TaxID=714549 RepID=UPI00082ECEFC|nr:N-acetylmuramoyl-L-alanine amidase [Hydrotalea flava]RTL56725.1 MAG: N-acetylmuramoyl-L-alanine amidase [Sphingobacteriales bacterium]